MLYFQLIRTIPSFPAAAAEHKAEIPAPSIQTAEKADDGLVVVVREWDWEFSAPLSPPCID